MPRNRRAAVISFTGVAPQLKLDGSGRVSRHLEYGIAYRWSDAYNPDFSGTLPVSELSCSKVYRPAGRVSATSAFIGTG